MVDTPLCARISIYMGVWGWCGILFALCQHTYIYTKPVRKKQKVMRYLILKIYSFYNLNMVFRISRRMNFKVVINKVCLINGLVLNEVALLKISLNSVLLVIMNL